MDLTTAAPSSRKRSMCTVCPDKECVAISSTQTTGVQTDTTAIQTLSSYSTDIEPVTNSNNNSGSMYSTATCQTLSIVDSALDSSENSHLENFKSNNKQCGTRNKCQIWI